MENIRKANGPMQNQDCALAFNLVAEHPAYRCHKVANGSKRAKEAGITFNLNVGVTDDTAAGIV
jgi:hypothetical protein